VKQPDETSRALFFPSSRLWQVVALVPSVATVLRDGLRRLVRPVLPASLRQRVRHATETARRAVEPERRKAGPARHLGRRQIENANHASLSVAEAVAGVPESSVRAVLQTIALQARNLTSAEFAAVGIGGDSNRPFECWVVAGLGAEDAQKIGRDPRPVGLLGLVPRQNRSVRLRDLRERAEFRGFPPNHPTMTSFLGVPIRYKGRGAGNLYLANKQGGSEFTEHDQYLVELLAKRAGVAIETARLYAAEGKQRAWLQAVIDQMPEGIVLMDEQGHVAMRNRSLLSLAAPERPEWDRFGNPVTVELHYPTGGRLPPDDLPLVKAFVDKKVILGDELLARRPDGRLIAQLVSAAPILMKSGKLAGATMVLEDVSTLKDLERVREEWVSIVAHELQQPINTILLRADLLRTSLHDDKHTDDVRHIRTAAKLLSRMVSDLLDASQLEAHRMRVNITRVDVARLVHAVVERIPEAVARTKITEPMDRRLIVLADSQRIEQIVTNLLSNALKYGLPNSEIWIDIDESGADAKVSVANWGPVVPADELPLLFERYVRSRAARAGVARGLGLGLYIAKRLVEAQGGRIWAESGPGQMTTFSFTVPLDVSHIVPASSPRPALEAVSASAALKVQP
jgi:signal transduction histidine kinase